MVPNNTYSVVFYGKRWLYFIKKVSRPVSLFDVARGLDDFSVPKTLHSAILLRDICHGIGITHIL